MRNNVQNYYYNFFLSYIVLCLRPCPGSGRDLGRYGAVYPIVEPDALAEMKAKAARVDWRKHLDREKMTSKIREYKPKDLKRLRPAGTATFCGHVVYP